MRRKVIALLLSVCMLALPLGGCGSRESGNSENTSAVNGKETQADGNAQESGNGEAVKLTGLYVSHSLTKDMNELQWLQELEEKANVDIEWEQIYSDWETTKSTRFASGDIPDILINATVDSDYTKYNGLFMELSSLIEENAPNVMQMLRRNRIPGFWQRQRKVKYLPLLNSRGNGRPRIQSCSLIRNGWIIWGWKCRKPLWSLRRF